MQVALPKFFFFYQNVCPFMQITRLKKIKTCTFKIKKSLVSAEQHFFSPCCRKKPATVARQNVSAINFHPVNGAAVLIHAGIMKMENVVLFCFVFFFSVLI